jgi:NADH-quinone oxidoreductase subunit M
MNGFVGEFLVLSGSFQANTWYGVMAASGVIWSACYMLWMYKRVFYGKVTNRANAALPDMSSRERMALWPTAVFALVMGVASPLWMNAIEPAARAALTGTQAIGTPSGTQATGTPGGTQATAAINTRAMAETKTFHGARKP